MGSSLVMELHHRNALENTYKFSLYEEGVFENMTNNIYIH